jgi:hypothetical protein
MFHPVLEWLNPAISLVVESAMNGRVEAACRKVGLHARINGLRVVPIKPRIQFLQLLIGELSYCALDFLYRI